MRGSVLAAQWVLLAHTPVRSLPGVEAQEGLPTHPEVHWSPLCSVSSLGSDTCPSTLLLYGECSHTSHLSRPPEGPECSEQSTDVQA